MTDLSKFEEYVRENKEKAFHAVYSVIRNDSASSITKDAFIAVYKNGFPKDISRYAYKFAKRSRPKAAEQAQQELLIDDAARRASDVRNALCALSEQTGEIVCLCDMFGYSYAEAAAVTALSEDFVASRLNKGRKSIKEVLKRRWALPDKSATLSGECAQFSEYTDQILGSTASEEVSRMFFSHLNSCEPCKKRYEIAKMLRDAVSEVAPVLENSFVDTVMQAAETVKRENPSFWQKNKKALVFSSIAVVVVVALIIALPPILKKTITEPVQTAKKAESDTQIINAFAERLSEGSSKNLWTADEFASLCGFGADASYIAFLNLTTDTALGSSRSISYISQSLKNGVAFYSTPLPSTEVFALCQTRLLSGCSLEKADTGNGLLVVFCQN